MTGVILAACVVIAFTVALIEDTLRGSEMSDPVHSPDHYTWHPSRTECIEITEAFNFNIGNAIKYLWRAGRKGQRIEDLKKARWYVNREIARIEAEIDRMNEVLTQ